MKTYPLPTVRSGHILVIRSTLSLSHRCDGEEVVLELTGPDRGRVLASDRCQSNPREGCDGIPLFSPGDEVRLPRDWPLWSLRLDVTDLSLIPRGEVRP